MSKKKEEQKFELEQNLDLKTLTDYMEELVKTFKAGKVVLQQEDQYINLSPDEQISLQISAKQKSEKESLSLLISWEPKKSQEEATLKISQTEPEPKATPDLEEKTEIAGSTEQTSSVQESGDSNIGPKSDTKSKKQS